MPHPSASEPRPVSYLGHVCSQFPAAEAVKIQEAPLRTTTDTPLVEEMQSPAAEDSAVDFLNSLVDFQDCDAESSFEAWLHQPQTTSTATTSTASALNWSL